LEPPDSRGPLRPGLALDDDLDVLVERSQQHHQALHREAGKLVPAQRGHLGLAHSKHSGGVLLRQHALVEDLIECMSQAKLRLPRRGVRKAQVGEPPRTLAASFAAFSGFAAHGAGTDSGARSVPRACYPASTFRGRPPKRPFVRELAAFRSLVRLPTSAAAVTRRTFERVRPRVGLDTVATRTSALGCSTGWASRYAVNVRTIALAALPRVGPCA
jgi:hypothetical protein